MVLVLLYWYFFGTENRNGIELYHLQNTGKEIMRFLLSSANVLQTIHPKATGLI